MSAFVDGVFLPSYICRGNVPDCGVWLSNYGNVVFRSLFVIFERHVIETCPSNFLLTTSIYHEAIIESLSFLTIEYCIGIHGIRLLFVSLVVLVAFDTPAILFIQQCEDYQLNIFHIQSNFKSSSPVSGLLVGLISSHLLKFGLLSW